MVICILGRQSAFGLAELESRFGAAKVMPLGEHAAQVSVEPDDIPAHLLGSIIKLAEPLTTLDTTDWQRVAGYCQQNLPAQFAEFPEGKLKLGISVYGLRANLKTIQRTALELKKAIRISTGRSIRVVPNSNLELNSAQILHNQLTSEVGCELLMIQDGHKTHIARTFYVQDIDDYARRDFARPKRDAFVGMLPPKLAQTMLNLAQVAPSQRVLDPFCGTGVVLQEAALMGCTVYGTDINKRMIEYAQDNLKWLQATYHIEFKFDVEASDAKTATWTQPIDSVVCESYLGKPLSILPVPSHLKQIMAECNDLIDQFLRNLHGQLKPGTRCCIAIPAWFTGKDFLHLEIVDYLEKIGYNRVSFKHVSTQDLIYHRNDQIVAREMLVLTVKE